jgi:hypothetical protein|tara:strand:- start:411 stop:833 length:423 start_codon:yes stop_codon:yes gene_type:complete
MSTQQDPTVYSQCIQWQLTDILSPVPVYAVFNRNYAKQPKFVTWQLRNVHQPVYTGQTQSNKGIDSPTFQATVFAQNMNDAFNLSNTILQSLHGYSGMFGDPTDNGFFVAKVDCVWLYNTYDNELGLNQIILDCTFYVPT